MWTTAIDFVFVSINLGNHLETQTPTGTATSPYGTDYYDHIDGEDELEVGDPPFWASRNLKPRLID